MFYHVFVQITGQNLKNIHAIIILLVDELNNIIYTKFTKFYYKKDNNIFSYHCWSELILYKNHFWEKMHLNVKLVYFYCKLCIISVLEHGRNKTKQFLNSKKGRKILLNEIIKTKSTDNNLLNIP